MCEGIWAPPYRGALLLMLNAWHLEWADPDWVQCLRSLPLGEWDASERNSEQTVRLSWELLKLAKRNTERRVCLKFLSFCELRYLFMACKAKPMSDRVSSPRSTLTCLGALLLPLKIKGKKKKDICLLVKQSCSVTIWGHGEPWFNPFLSLMWFKSTHFTSQNTPALLHWGKTGMGKGKGSLAPFCVHCASAARHPAWVIQESSTHKVFFSVPSPLPRITSVSYSMTCESIKDRVKTNESLQ